MKYNEFLNAIISKSQELFYVNSELIQGFLQLAPPELEHKNIIKLHRKTDNIISKTGKTILISSLPSTADIEQVLFWASAVKEEIIDPESSDLYLFLMFEEDMVLDVCLRIESTEQFCRKYVLRPQETAEAFLERTFLTQLNTVTQDTLGADPTLNAFSKVQAEFYSFTIEEQILWRNTLLSGQTGGDLISAIFNNNEEQNS